MFNSDVVKLSVLAANFAQEDINNLRTDYDHDEYDTVDKKIEVRNDDCLYDISTQQIYM